MRIIQTWALLFLIIPFAAFSQQKVTDDPEYKKFIDAFPKLSLPFQLTPDKLVGAKLVSKMPHINKIFSVIGGDTYAIGIIDDCTWGADMKALLMGQMSGDEYQRKWMFMVVKIRNGYNAGQHIFTDGFFTQDYKGFQNGSSVTISADKQVTVVTSQNNRSIVRSTSGKCN